MFPAHSQSVLGKISIVSKPKTQSTVARHGQLHGGSIWKRILAIVGAGIAVVMVSGVALGGYVATKFLGALNEGAIELDDEVVDIVAPDLSKIEGGVNILIIGIDNDINDKSDPNSKRGNAVLNDVNILVHIAEDRSNATVVSFPRDLIVPIPRCGNYSAMSAQPLNNAYYYGGLSCVHKTIAELTGLENKIPYAAQVTFKGVIGLSNAVGGTEVCLTSKVGNADRTGFEWEKGRHVLKGKEALAFLRTRHGVGDGSDLSRINLQQIFMSSLLRTVTSNDTLSDPVKLYNIAQAATSNMTLSTSLANLDTIVGLAKILADLDLDKVAFVTYPGKTGSIKYPGKVERVPALADELFRLIKNDIPVIPNDPARVPTTGDKDAQKPDSSKENTSGGSGSSDGGSSGSGSSDKGKDPVKLPSGVEGVVAGSPVCVGN